MKKVFLKSMLLLCALIVGSGSLWATETEVFNAACSSTPSGWTLTNGNTANAIQQTDYWLFEAGGEDYVTTSVYDLSSYSSATITAEVATYGSGSNPSAKIEISYNGGTTFTESTTEGNPTSKSYVDISYDLTSSLTSTVVIRVSNSINSGRGLRFKNFVLTGTTGGGVSVTAPIFNNGTNTYNNDVNVKVSNYNEDYIYFYTTNGDTPGCDEELNATGESHVYSHTTGVNITATSTLKMIAADIEANKSNTTSATYTLKVANPTASVTPGTIISAQDVELTTETEDATIYYTLDGSEPNTSSSVYSSAIHIDETKTIKAYATKSGYTASSKVSFAYTYFEIDAKNINSGYYEKLTDIDDLEDGDAIIIVNETALAALGTTQNDNNRGISDELSFVGSVTYAPEQLNAQKLTVKKVTEGTPATDYYYFYTGSGFLYAASSSKNYLRTETVPDANAKATISISSGNATITFKGSNTNNLLKYNSSSGIFSCYASGQTAVQIYKEVVHNESVTIGSTGWATFCSNYALNFDATGVDAYIITGHSGSAITKSDEPLESVPANTPLLLNATAGNHNIPLIASSSTSTTGNLLVRGTGDPVGYASGKTRYVLMANGGKAEFQLLAESGATATVGTNKAYLEFNGTISFAPSALRLTDEENNATNIEAIEAAEEGVKFIQDGKLFIMRNGVVYDAMGRTIR